MLPGEYILPDVVFLGWFTFNKNYFEVLCFTYVLVVPEELF